MNSGVSISSVLAAVGLLAASSLAGQGRNTAAQRILSTLARIVAWVWAALAGVGGLVLLVHQGPWPITNGWFAMVSGTAACPLTASLVKRYGGVTVPIGVQLVFALLLFLAGRVAVVLVLHRPFFPRCSTDCW